MQIDLTTPGLAVALLARLKKEYADTCEANFALDILCEMQAAEIRRLTERNAALIETNTNLRADNELLRTDRVRQVIEADKPKRTRQAKTGS